MAEQKPVNYWDYIRVEELLDLQGGLEESEEGLTDDEVLFITVHQVYELWFKLIVRELRSLRALFRAPVVAEQELSVASRGLRRVATILRRCTGHFEVIETLTTREYLAFRDKLTPASGFQSAQLRQIEIILGLDESQRIPLGLEGSYLEALKAHDGTESSALRRVLDERAHGPSLLDAVNEWLERTPIDGEADCDAALDRFVDEYTAAHAAEADKSCELSLARTLAPEDEGRLRETFAAEKAALKAFLSPTEEEGGARRRRVRASILFITTYRELPLLAWPRDVLNRLLELEQQLLVFRQRHARMVERVIGRRTGTGGSSGVDYLDQTALRYRVFRDLWASRTHQIRQVASPPLRNPAFYGFANG